MTKEWVEQKKKEARQRCDNIVNDITTKIKSLSSIDEKEAQKLLHKFYSALTEALDKGNTLKLDYFSFMDGWYFKQAILESDKEPSVKKQELTTVSNLLENLPIHDLTGAIYDMNHMERYLDSELKEFDGDIIITDPCYIIRKDREKDYQSAPNRYDFISYSTIEEYPDYRYDADSLEDYSEQYEKEQKQYDEAMEKWEKENIDDWERCEYGDDMEALGIINSMTRDTIYGDWSCTTFDTNTKQPIGYFCADAGLVSVFLLDEVLKYNPNLFNEHHMPENNEPPFWVTIIKNFKGTIQFVVEQYKIEYDEDTEFHEAGDVVYDYEVSVVGHGINKETGEPIDFKTTQTGL